MKHARIIIELIGTEGQLDNSEKKYGVFFLEDQAERIKQYILSLKTIYSNFGWTAITAHKVLTDEEVNNF